MIYYEPISVTMTKQMTHSAVSTLAKELKCHHVVEKNTELTIAIEIQVDTPWLRAVLLVKNKSPLLQKICTLISPWEL